MTPYVVVQWTSALFRVSERRSMAQAVSRRPFTAEARLRSHSFPYETCVVRSGTRTVYFPCTSVFPCQCHFTDATYSYFIYRRRYIILTHDSVAQENKCLRLGLSPSRPVSVSACLRLGLSPSYFDIRRHIFRP